MYIFDGNKLAQEKELLLKERIASDFSGQKLKIAAILFVEDKGSRLYTNLKSEAAARVGIDYEIFEFSLSDLNSSESNPIKRIHQLNNDPSVTGIIIQKPWRKTWALSQGEDFVNQSNQADDKKKFERDQFNQWWSGLTKEISEQKDVDGLHPNTIERIKNGDWRENGKVLPATCRAVLEIIDFASSVRVGEMKKSSGDGGDLGKVIIIGKSDLLGKPLYYELLSQKYSQVELIASKELKARERSGQKLLDAGLIVSATGRKNLITGDMVSDGVAIIDVGEPRPDVDFASVSQKTSFITPVPGGVGPMTVISLLENCVDLIKT